MFSVVWFGTLGIKGKKASETQSAWLDLLILTHPPTHPLYYYCVVPENIHTPHGGTRKFRGGGGSDRWKFPEGRGVRWNHNFQRVFWAKNKGGLTRAAFWSKFPPTEWAGVWSNILIFSSNRRGIASSLHGRFEIATKSQLKSQQTSPVWMLVIRSHDRHQTGVMQSMTLLTLYGRIFS